MKRIRDISIGFLVCFVLMTTTPVLADSIIQKIDVILNSVQVQVDGEKLDTNSILYNGSTYLPMRTVAEAVGKDVEWNEDTKTANIIYKNETDTVINKTKEGDDITNKIVENTELKTSDGISIKIINEKQYVYTSDYYKIYNNEDNKRIQYLSQNGTLVTDFTKPINMYINGEIALTAIKGINLGVYKFYVEADYYENTILPLISK